MRILAVIPVRYAASRFPGKPLAELAGRPVVQWVYAAATSCPSFDAVIVATDSDEIAACVRNFGGAVELTRATHPSGTDRVAEVAERHSEADVIANVQGDQPFASPEMLSELVAPYRSGDRPAMTTLACPLTDPAAWADPNVVKVVCDVRGYALYFSRSPIPSGGSPPDGALHHLGLYAFTRDALLAFPRLEPTPLEGHERLEQLRALENGVRIRVCRTERSILEINTLEDLRAAEQHLAARGGVG